MHSPDVTFVLTGEANLAALRHLDPDRDWQEFVTGERAWILQTYLRLRAVGAPVELADTIPREGVAVFGSKQRQALRTIASRGRSSILVGVRADVGEALIADFEIVQNRQQADGARRFFIPHWPQPGLIARAQARGTRIENVAFKGFSGNLHEAFAGIEWRDWLNANGMHWISDAVQYSKTDTSGAGLNWNDFREIDLVLAVRPPRKDLYPRKPATKLYNAWRANVPALLGPEIAYRELRQSPLDYVEIADAADARASIERLRREPRLFEQMVANGATRAAEFSPGTIASAWTRLLFDELPRLSDAPHVRRWRGRSLLAKEIARRAARVLRPSGSG